MMDNFGYHASTRAAGNCHRRQQNHLHSQLQWNVFGRARNTKYKNSDDFQLVLADTEYTQYLKLLERKFLLQSIALLLLRFPSLLLVLEIFVCPRSTGRIKPASYQIIFLEIMMRQASFHLRYLLRFEVANYMGSTIFTALDSKVRWIILHTALDIVRMGEIPSHVFIFT
ncbi:hypothetical protein MKW98_028520 [Papaver atlanticum]|uniref:Uncharacterized protein n=1 Tax=Papaver atlanticum TaxID=357466 RepID=A0AAD4XVP3_9MAGN|nr:hypothetical protein MKW98_028520 [Papaver atlanticum]